MQRQRVKPEYMMEQKTMQKTVYDVLRRYDVDVLQDTETIRLLVTSSMYGLGQMQKQQQKKLLLTQQELVYKTILPEYIPPTIPPRIRYVRKPKEEPPFKPRRPRLPDLEKERFFVPTPGQGYNVYIKERQYFKGKKKKPGRFYKLSKYPLSRKDALALGANAVDYSHEASFQIKPTRQFAQPLKIDVTPFGRIQNKFYLKDDTYIEKTDYRIDTPGEVKGISARGWYSQKHRQQQKKIEKARKRRVARRKETFEDFFVFPELGMQELNVNWEALNKMWGLK
jgi:hypothetical protein